MVRPKECNIRFGSGPRFRTGARALLSDCNAPTKVGSPLQQTVCAEANIEEITNVPLTNPLNHTETLHIASSVGTVNGYSMKEDRTQPEVATASHVQACRRGQPVRWEEKFMRMARDYSNARNAIRPAVSFQMLQNTIVSFGPKLGHRKML